MLIRTTIFLFILCLCSQMAKAEGKFTRNDLIGSNSICQAIKANKDNGNLCSPVLENSYDDLDTSASAMDNYLAITELKRNIQLMAQSQVQTSMRLLNALGMQRPGMDLDRKLAVLKTNGVEYLADKTPVNAELSKKYLIAAMRYHELKTLSANRSLKNQDNEEIQNKLQWLELRYPVISNYHFKSLKDSVCLQLKTNCPPHREDQTEEAALDNFLLNDSPAKLTELNLGNTPESYTGKIAGMIKENKDPYLEESLSKGLVSELQASFSNQLNPLLNLNSFKECDLLNLHSKVTLQVINSSGNPDQMFKKYCGCQDSEKIIDEHIVMGLEVASLGGLGLCLVPTGVGQVLGCPTAAIAGLGATGANAINFIDSAGKFQTISEQKNIVKFLDRTNLDKAEENFLKDKEFTAFKEAGVSGVASLIGFGVGNIGMKGLIKVFEHSKLSLVVKKLNVLDKEKFEKALEKLDPADQTKAFVVLEKLDHESREALVKNPTLFAKEFKKGGNFCDL